jgi:ribosomal protein S18 acetylase RimI-like enzyme
MGSSPEAGQQAPVRIARLTGSDWELFAGLRLRALSEAFGVDNAQYRQEAQFTEAHWRHRINEHTQFVAWRSERPVGLIAAQRESQETVYLYSLWLDPDARGHGLAQALIAATLDWARGLGTRTVTLRVAAENAVARALYEGFGFTAAPRRDGVADDELAMSLTVE